MSIFCEVIERVLAGLDDEEPIGVIDELTPGIMKERNRCEIEQFNA